MTEAVQLALIVAIPPTLTALTGLVVVLQKLKNIEVKTTKIEKQTNGNLSDAQAKVDRAEKILPGVTGEHPPGAEIQARMSVNDPRTSDPPKVTENVTRLEKP